MLWLLPHTVAVLLLAILVLALCRCLRLGPAARHALWLLVLLKLLTPPFVSWPWVLPLLPVDSREAATDPDHESAAENLFSSEKSGENVVDLQGVLLRSVPGDVPLSLPVKEEVSIPQPDPPVDTEHPADRWDRLANMAAAVWLFGMAVVAFVQFQRFRRIQRWLGHARPPTCWLISQVKELAFAMRVPPPRLAVLPGLSSPIVWAGGRTYLLWSEALEEHLTPEGCRAVLLHELAHLARRDHWVGWLLLVGGCIWWWHPLYYLVRRQLNRQAELASDARVVATLPEARRSYAEALLDVCQRQSWTAAAAPALGVTGRRRDLERRLVMIMRANVPSRLSLRMLLGIGFLGLVLLPTWTLGQADKTTSPAKTAQSERDKQLQNAEQKLQKLLKDLEAQRRASPSGKKTGLVDVTETTDRDKKFQELEAKVKAVLKEVQALRSSEATRNDIMDLVRLNDEVSNATLRDIGSAASSAPTEVTLSRTTYKLPAAKAEALGKFLQQHVKAAVMETKVNGDNLTVTTTPEVQRGIGQFIALIEGKSPQGAEQEYRLIQPSDVPPATSGAPPVPASPAPPELPRGS